MSPGDYDAVSTILEFGACDTRRCTEILIMDDMRVEQTKSIPVTLERTSDLDSRIILDPFEGDVEIIDNDGVQIHL